MGKYKIIPSSRTIIHSPISIGHKAEKGVKAIEFDLTAWVETYGSGTATIIMRRWGDEIPYPVALELDENNKATWTLSDIDTAKAGMAYAQLNYIVGDEVVKKSDIYTFRVMDSLTGEGEPPEAYESWLEHLTHLAAEAMAEVLDIEGIVTDKTLTVDGGIADGKATGDALALKADKSTTYTKTEVDKMIEDVEVETDTTLSVSGAAADAKATGDALSALEDAVTEETDKLKADLEDINTATASDVGKALIVESVTDGKATFTFGETGGDISAISEYSNLFVAENATEGVRIASGGNNYTDATAYVSEYIPITADTTYTKNSPTIDVYHRFATYDSSKSFIRKVDNLNTITAVDGEAYLRFCGLLEEESTATLYSNDPGDFTAIDRTARSDIADMSAAVTESSTAVSAITTATANDVGKALTVGTVEDGAVTSWTYSDILDAEDTTVRLNMTTELTTDSSPQLVDDSQYTKYTYSTQYEYRNVQFDFSQNGIYCANPIGGATMTGFTLYDANDNLLSFNDGSGNSYEVKSNMYIERIDDTHVRRYSFYTLDDLKNGVIRETHDYTYSGTIVYAKIANFRFPDTEHIGVTYNRLTSVYIPYGKDVTYNEEMFDNALEYYGDNNKFREIHTGQLSPWMFRSCAETDNIFDDRKINWAAKGDFYPLKRGETIPVTGGQTIICNKIMGGVKEYTSDGTATSIGTVSQYSPHTLASTTEYITCYFAKGTAAGKIPADGYEPIYMYYAETLYSRSDISRVSLPKYQLNGYDVNSNLYDQCIPEERSAVARMLKAFAVRELNHQRNAFRIGTFNVYVQRNATNRETVKTELENYGVDICGFQESKGLVSGAQYNLGDYCKGWLYKYCNTNADTFASTRQMVSVYEVLSSEEFVYECNSSSSFLKCVIQLPRYKHCMDGLTTLSFYVYHGNVNSETTRLAEIDEILAKVADDTSDFIIVVGDTNDFSANKPCWAKFNTAGLTPVHDGISATVTEASMVTAGNSLDNIFVSSGITCLYYDVVMSNEWKYIPSNSSSEVAVSDHDMLYADLQFDFDAVIAARRAESISE